MIPFPCLAEVRYRPRHHIAAAIAMPTAAPPSTPIVASDALMSICWLRPVGWGAAVLLASPVLYPRWP